MFRYPFIKQSSQAGQRDCHKRLSLKLSVVIISLGFFVVPGCFDSNSETPAPLVDTGSPKPGPDTVSLECVTRGAWAWDNWTKTAAGGSGNLPAGETNADYVRCKACHGWDQMGIEGGYAHRTRTENRPNAGQGDVGNTSSRNISTGSFGNHDEITLEQILQEGSGRSLAQGSLSWDGGSATGITTGNLHPDFSPANNPGDGNSLTSGQTDCLVAFLNYADARADQVFSTIDTSTSPVTYTVIPEASITAGSEFYTVNCASCHGAPMQLSTAQSNNAPGPGGLIAYLRKDGKASELMHKMHWGISGTVMLRKVMGDPDSGDVANVISYLQDIISNGVVAAFDDSAVTPINTAIDINVLVNDSDANGDVLLLEPFDDTSLQGGTVSKDSNNLLRYTPLTSFEGDDSFSYSVSDGNGNTDTATVSITVGNLAASNGKQYYLDNCAVCHAAGNLDTSYAFNAGDVAGKSDLLISNLDSLDSGYQLMGAFSAMKQQQLNELKAWLDTL